MAIIPAEPRVPIVSARGIRKAFGPIEVLHGVDFDVLAGEVHVLAGENGAGKSTLIKILSGVYGDFSGELRVGGEPRRFASPDEATRAGIATIHQELSLVPSMTVTDNLFLLSVLAILWRLRLGRHLYAPGGRGAISYAKPDGQPARRS